MGRCILHRPVPNIDAACLLRLYLLPVRVFTQQATAVATATFAKRGLELHRGLANGCWRLSTFVGLVKASVADAQQPTGVGRRICLLLQLSNQVIGCFSSQAKRAVAFLGHRCPS